MNGEDNTPHCFRIVSPERTYLLQAEDDFDRQEWVESLQQVIACLLNGALSGQNFQAQKPNVTYTTQRSIFDKIINNNSHKDSHNNNHSIQDNLNLDDSFNRRGATHRLESAKRSSSFNDLFSEDYQKQGSQKNWQFLHKQPQINHHQALERVRQVPGNHICSDCNAKDPDWASLNLGVMFCIECSGAHRKLGVHVSKVRSLTLDVKVWDQDMLELFDRLGNGVVNQIYEARLLPRHRRGHGSKGSASVNHNNQGIINGQTTSDQWVWEQSSSDEEESNDSFMKQLKDESQQMQADSLQALKPRYDSPASQKETYIKNKYMNKLYIKNVDLSPEELQLSLWGSVQVNNIQQCLFYIAKGIDINHQYNHFLAMQLQERANGFQGDGGRRSFSRSTKHINENLRSSMQDPHTSPSKPPLQPIQTPSSDPNTPQIALLHLASTDDSYITIMELLIQNGVQINQQDQMGRTALHYCMLFDNFQGAKFLVRRGANIEITDRNNRDALKLRMIKGSLPDEELFHMLSKDRDV